MTKSYMMIVVSYETAGGHGEHDVIEEGLIGRLRKEFQRQRMVVDGVEIVLVEFEIECFQSLTAKEAQCLIEK